MVGDTADYLTCGREIERRHNKRCWECETEYCRFCADYYKAKLYLPGDRFSDGKKYDYSKTLSKCPNCGKYQYGSGGDYDSPEQWAKEDKGKSEEYVEVESIENKHDYDKYCREHLNR